MWPEFFDDLDFDRLSRYVFGSLRLAGAPEPNARHYLTRAYGSTWPSEVPFWERTGPDTWEKRTAVPSEFEPVLPTREKLAEPPFLGWLTARSAHSPLVIDIT
jgi:hypothetical protein